MNHQSQDLTCSTETFTSTLVDPQTRIADMCRRRVSLWQPDILKMHNWGFFPIH